MRLSPAFVLVLLPALVVGCIGPQNASTSTTSSSPEVSTSPACSAVAPSGASSSPGTQVSNQPGAFSYSSSQAAQSGKEEYKWSNPTPTARVSFSGSAATGTLKLTMLDACGKQVFSKSVSANGQNSQTTEAGTPGAWLIRMEWSTYTGNVQLSITSG